MECERCDGFMMGDVVVLFKSDQSSYPTLKCVNCGNVVDPQIIENRISPLAASRKTYKRDRVDLGGRA